MRAYVSAALLTLLTATGCGPAEEPVPVVQSRSAPIVGGVQDDASSGVVGLAIAFGELFFSGHCTGTLIAPNLVLTARHCVAQQSSQTQGVVCGASGFQPAGPGNLFRATTLAVRPDEDGPEFYKGVGAVVVPDANDLCGNDVALLQLEGAGFPPEVATPVVPRIDGTPAEGEIYTAIGYGLRDPNDNRSSGTRMRLEDNYVNCSKGECNASVKDTEWQGTSRTCPGDSGGPAIDAEGRVVGVLSRGPQGCLSSVYGDVGSWKDMIIDAARVAAEEGGYEPPFWVTTGESLPPVPDPVGLSCGDDAPCPKSWPCQLDATGAGVCVPPCSAENTSCPGGHQCYPEFNACLDTSRLPASGSDESGGGCALGGAGASPSAWSAALVALLMMGVARRRSRS